MAPVAPPAGRKMVTIHVDGIPHTVIAGRSIGAALLEQGISVLRWSRRSTEPRGLFCGIGACYECAVWINGLPGERACMTPAVEGMRVDRRLAQRVDR